jgi:hypothetical protein
MVLESLRSVAVGKKEEATKFRFVYSQKYHDYMQDEEIDKGLG